MQFRPALYLAVVLATVSIVYGVAMLFADNKRGDQVRISMPLPEKSRPWYRSQKSPPSMVTAPDKPILPDTANSRPTATAAARAYEEALPKEVYIPPVSGPAAPVPTAPATSTEKEMPAWRRYAVHPAGILKKPMIVVVIDDMGVDRRHSDKIAAIKAPLTLSFMSYANDLANQTRAARDSGHELLLHISMQPSNPGLDAGPNVLLVDIDRNELRRRLLWGLSRFTEYVGVNNHMGSKFTQDIKAMTMVMKEIKRRGLLFLDSRTTAKTVGPLLARRMAIPYAERNIFLDNINDENAIKARLDETERLARRKGVAIAIGHPRKATIKALRAWIPGLRGRGFQLVPLTSVIATKTP